MEQKNAPYNMQNGHNGDAKPIIDELIYKEIIAGTQPSVIRRKLVNDEYGLGLPKLTPKAAARHYEKVRDRIKKDFQEKLPMLKEELTASLYDILNECRHSKDRTNAIRTVESIAKLVGAYAPEKVEMKHDIVIDFGFENPNDSEN
jgi:hypothetical protein